MVAPVDSTGASVVAAVVVGASVELVISGRLSGFSALVSVGRTGSTDASGAVVVMGSVAAGSTAEVWCTSGGTSDIVANVGY